ncbi:MAG: hypothetical protein AB1486_08275 [Planctomycetota bacterium]
MHLGMDVEHLFLQANNNGANLLLFRPPRKVSVPRGTYRLVQYDSYRRDPQGDHWYLRATATRRTPWLRWEEDDVAKLELGEPYTPEVWLAPSPGSGRTPGTPEELVLQFGIGGVAGERVVGLGHIWGQKTAIALDRKGALPREPTYTILGTGGEVVAQGSFEYG